MAKVENVVTGRWGMTGGAWSVLVHGGAGDVGAEALPAHVRGCKDAAAEAARVLGAGGSAVDAVQRAVEVLEDDPRFNAGTGACLNADGHIQLDASLMEGKELRAGAVCAMSPFKHPIAIARKAMEDGVHILYAGEGADRFARAQGFDPSTDEAMTTPAARARLVAVRSGKVTDNWAGGTVGAVARDRTGTVAAATSTGGRVNKSAGRVGDSPILGAGTYADNDGGACSNTGDGEAVMRVCLAKTAIEWMRQGMNAEDAAAAAIRFLRERAGGTGGIILLDRSGRLGWARTTSTMTWGAASEGCGETLSGS